MQFIPFCLFTIICGYSLVMAAPVNKAAPLSQAAKQQKATEIANRLLKELAGEQHASHDKDQTVINNENKDVGRPDTEKVETLIEKPGQLTNIEDIDSDEDADLMPTLDDLYEIYGDNLAQMPDDEDLSSELIDELMVPVNKERLLKFIAEQEKYAEPAVHTPIMADNAMKAENHRRRRSIY